MGGGCQPMAARRWANGFGTMSRRHQRLYKPADLSYFIGELRRMGGRTDQSSPMGEAGRADFWHALRLYLQGRPKRP